MFTSNWKGEKSEEKEREIEWMSRDTTQKLEAKDIKRKNKKNGSDLLTLHFRDTMLKGKTMGQRWEVKHKTL